MKIYWMSLMVVVAGMALAQTQNENPRQLPADNQLQAQPAGAAAPIAHVLVYRHRRYAGSALAPSIYVDDKQIVRIGNGRRASIRLAPGAHSIRSDDKSSAISIEAKAGEEYYIRIDEETGFWKGHGKLTLLMPEQGRAEYKLQKPVEDERKIDKELIESDTESAEKKGDSQHEGK